jgi:hypothetical protein
MDTTDFLLTLLTFATGAVTISNFYVARKKDSKNEGAQAATFSADLRYIKELLQDVRSETRDIKKAQNVHSEHLAQLDAQMQSALERIERMEKHVYNQEG